MNLIGHYACATAPSPALRAGAVLPDLAGLYRRKVRAFRLLRDWRADTPEVGDGDMGDLLAGVAFHYTVDAHFHRAPLFKRTAGALQQALLDASGTPGLKRFLPAHVLCELYLDHLLLRRNPAMGEAFYQDVDGARRLLVQFVSRHPKAEADSFEVFLDHIVDGRFVDAYHAHDPILDRMDRILSRFRQRPLEPAERKSVADYFTRNANETLLALDEFLAEMRDVVLPRAIADSHGGANLEWPPPGADAGLSPEYPLTD